MSAPNIDLYLPKTYVFRRGEVAYVTRSAMERIGTGGIQYVYLPLGLSMVTVIATSMGGANLELTMNQGGEAKTLATVTAIKEPTLRMWTGQISNHATSYADGGVYLRIFAEKVTTAAKNNGSVSVQITNFPPET